MQWSSDKIVAWHCMVMPNATIETQMRKVEDELAEFREAMYEYTQEDGSLSDAIEELADVYIASLILERRYESAVGSLVRSSVIESACRLLMDESGIGLRLLNMVIQSVDDKMTNNANRVWEETSKGYYQHVDTEGLQ